MCSKSTNHVRADLGTGAKHQFALSVGVVDLTRQQGGELVRSAYRLIQEALPIASAKRQDDWKEKHSHKTIK